MRGYKENLWILHVLLSFTFTSITIRQSYIIEKQQKRHAVSYKMICLHYIIHFIHITISYFYLQSLFLTNHYLIDVTIYISNQLISIVIIVALSNVQWRIDRVTRCMTGLNGSFISLLFYYFFLFFVDLLLSSSFFILVFKNN